MAIKDEVIRELASAIKMEESVPTTSMSAIVSRIDDEGTVWVNLAGSTKETPTELTSSEVEPGDAVNVEWRNNKLYIAGNFSNPSAGIVRVDMVEQAASIANEAAASAVSDAGVAREAAEDAKATAESVHGIAQEAKTSADAAKTSADSAHTSAQSALRGLSQVEDVVGTLNWISEHGTYELTEDTEVQEGKLYFTRTTTYENLLPKVYHDTSGEVNGIAFAVNSDGSISMQGTSTETFQFILTRAADNEIRLYKGRYSLSGGVSDKLNLVANHLNGETWILDGNDTGRGATLTVGANLAQSESIYYYINSGVTVDTVVYPKLYNLDLPIYTYTVITEPAGNPSEQEWYELDSVDEAVTNYIASHLALTNEGLYVLANDSEWKVLIASDGVRIIDAENEVVSTFSSYMEIGKSYAPHIKIESTMLSFYGTADKQTMSIDSSSRVKEEYTQTLLNTETATEKYVLTAPTNIFHSKLDYEAVDGVLTLRMTAEDSGSVIEHTFSSSADTEFTLGQVLFRYSSEAQSIYGEVSGLITPRRVLYYFVYDYPDYVHPVHAATITGGFKSIDIEELNPATAVITLAGNPISGTNITVSCVALITKVGEWNFTAGTSATKTFSYDGYTFTAVYNAAENTISCQSNKTQSRMFPVKLQSVIYEALTYGISNIEISYTREYLAPVFSLGTNNEHASTAICTSALGHNLTVQGDAQIAIGKYNDNQSDTAFEIGNGTHIARSNAYEVTEDGDIRLALDTNAGSGTDYEIYSALQALGWTDCII